MKKTENNNLNEINNKRVETTKKRVAHAINLLNNPIECLDEGLLIDNAVINISHAVNLLEAANQEMQWACKHFDWDNNICNQLDDACYKLGLCLASLVTDEDKVDIEMAGIEGKVALSMLGKSLATLIRWFDEDQNVSEI